MSLDKKEKKTSVALKYDYQGAPTVTASGKGLLGQEILDRAQKANVPIIEDERLVNLLSAIPLGEEIPVELYRAVAEVLVFVLQLETAIDREV
jgi:flagellar biosynthesis protein